MKNHVAFAAWFCIDLSSLRGLTRNCLSDQIARTARFRENELHIVAPFNMVLRILSFDCSRFIFPEGGVC